ncbi:unnamed protein product [Fraxinus pennsylvanica]|uniref:Remorin C-terminal domain-containing protein n=1 Tax=Fraxinus pennsylvanica TaxID=56036 RepID=A0AAD1ZVP4_9LAMI|nr:unnamed protein product [Fraxinus pennsylvanica]
MESLIRQTRYSNTGKERKEESRSARDRKILPQKSQSFEEKRRSQSWLRRQFSRQQSWDYDFTDDVLAYTTAVAASAFAVHSLDESRIWDQNKTAAYGPEYAPSTRTNNAAEVRGILRKRTVSFSDEIPNTSSQDLDAWMPTSGLKMPEKEIVPAPSMKKTPTFVDPLPEKSVPRKAAEPSPSMERTRTRSKKPERVVTTQTSSENPESVVPKPDWPTPGQSTPQPVETKNQYSPRPGDTMADAWEKAEMVRIEERYEMLRTRIQNWETKKKEKAMRRLEKTENELSDKKRKKAIERYRSDIERIQEIAAGAREQAKDNRRNEEFKVKAKANKIRATGKLPSTCLCF